MAETRARQTDTTVTRDNPVLRPGRPADPGQPDVPVSAAAPQAAEVGSTTQSDDRLPAPSQGADAAAALDKRSPVDGEQGETADDANGEDSDEVQRLYAESYQRRLRRLLRQCERVNLLDFNVLSLSGWPDNYTLNAARRRRDSWLLGAIIAALVFLSGMTGVVPAWIAGGGFGAFVVILLMGVPVVRRLYSSKPSYLDLVLYRQQLMRDARRHIAHLEGEVGLIWQCNELSEFNPALSSPRFSTLKHLSEQRRLARSLAKREHIRLYLIFMLEAEKAYERMQTAYFEGHQKAIDRGWKTVADTVTEPGRGGPATPSDAGGTEAVADGGEQAAETVKGAPTAG